MSTSVFGNDPARHSRQTEQTFWQGGNRSESALQMPTTHKIRQRGFQGVCQQGKSLMRAIKTE